MSAHPASDRVFPRRVSGPRLCEKIHDFQVDFPKRGLTIPPHDDPSRLPRGRTMGANRNESRDYGRMVALSQVGFGMVAPIVLGLVLDNKFGWAPWGVTVSAVLGLVGGFAHLLMLLKRFDDKDPGSPRQDAP